MNLIYLYDEFMRVPDHLEGQAVYIIDPEIQEGYEISDKVLMYRYQLAEQAGAEIYQGKTLDIIAEIHLQNPICLELLPDYFLSTDNYLQPAKRFFQYWNKVKKNLRY